MNLIVDIFCISVFDMLAFYQIFMVYRIFMARSFEIDKKRALQIVVIAFGVSLISMCIGAWSVCWSMLLIVLLLGKRKVWESVLIIPAIMLYTVLSIIPVMMIRSIITVPEIAALSQYGADILGVAADILGCIAVTILFRLLRKHNISLILRPLEVFGFVMFFFFEVFLLMGIAVIRVHYSGKTQILLNGGCLFFFLLAMGAYLWHLITLRHVRNLNVLVKQEEDYIQCQLSYLEQYKNENQDIRALRHDLRGHLQMLQSLQERNEKKKMQLYLDSLQAKTDMIKDLEFTGNQAADIVINNQKLRAEQMGIPFICEGAFVWLDSLNPMEACSLLSNLLDNAYDASINEEKPDISIKGGEQEHFWTLAVSNHAQKECKIDNNGMASTKKGHHGMGLSIVKQIVEKYGGICSFSWENQRFYCKILFPR